MTLSCIVCDKELENATPFPENQPAYPLAFHTHGHYGSTVFDPMTGLEKLEINICDRCLVHAAEEQKVLHYGKAVTFWNPKKNFNMEGYLRRS